MFTACVLGCFDYHELLRACLKSITPGLRTGYLSAIRVGLNSPSVNTLQCVADFVRDGAIADNNVYWAEHNANKYPMMRAMFHDAARPIDTEFVMWFDDDSYIDEGTAWWESAAHVCRDADYVGQQWRMGLTGPQRLWQQSQSWCKQPVPRMQPFMQGAWWCLRTARMREANWPIPELRHNGGDVLLGSVAQQLGWVSKVWSRNVYVNAGFTGKQSGAQRRCHTKLTPIGADYQHGMVYAPMPLPELSKFESAEWQN